MPKKKDEDIINDPEADAKKSKKKEIFKNYPETHYEA